MLLQTILPIVNSICSFIFGYQLSNHILNKKHLKEILKSEMKECDHFLEFDLLKLDNKYLKLYIENITKTAIKPKKVPLRLVGKTLETED